LSIISNVYDIRVNIPHFFRTACSCSSLHQWLTKTYMLTFTNHWSYDGKNQ